MNKHSICKTFSSSYYYYFRLLLTISLFLQSDGLPALVTLKKGLVALARQWMKFIVVTPAFKGVSLHRPAQPLKPQIAIDHEHEDGLGLDNGGGLQSDTSADGAEFEFDAGNFANLCGVFSYPTQFDSLFF